VRIKKHPLCHSYFLFIKNSPLEKKKKKQGKRGPGAFSHLGLIELLNKTVSLEKKINQVNRIKEHPLYD